MISLHVQTPIRQRGGPSHNPWSFLTTFDIKMLDCVTGTMYSKRCTSYGQNRVDILTKKIKKPSKYNNASFVIMVIDCECDGTSIMYSDLANNFVKVNFQLNQNGGKGLQETLVSRCA